MQFHLQLLIQITQMVEKFTNLCKCMYTHKRQTSDRWIRQHRIKCTVLPSLLTLTQTAVKKIILSWNWYSLQDFQSQQDHFTQQPRFRKPSCVVLKTHITFCIYNIYACILSIYINIIYILLSTKQNKSYLVVVSLVIMNMGVKLL
jgi:hypothetical protein